MPIQQMPPVHGVAGLLCPMDACSSYSGSSQQRSLWPLSWPSLCVGGGGGAQWQATTVLIWSDNNAVVASLISGAARDCHTDRPLQIMPAKVWEK